MACQVFSILELLTSDPFIGENSYWIDHFRITFGLFFKASLGAHSFIWKLVFICMWMATNLHMKGWAPGLALKKRPKVIWKWPIIITLSGIVAHFAGRNEEFGGLKCILARWNKPIKNEDQIIVRYEQPIKIEKPFQSLLTFSHSAGEKNILQSVLLSLFSVFIFSMPSKVILIA